MTSEMPNSAITRRQAAGLAGTIVGASLIASGAKAQEGTGPTDARLRPPVHDRLEILELIALYAWAYDCADATALRDTFTDDGQLYVWGRLMATAQAGFEDMIAHSLEMKNGKGWQHCADHHVFREYGGDSCKVYSYYTMFEADGDGGNVSGRALGHYASHCVRTPQGWRFVRRDVTRWNGKMPFRNRP